MDGFMIDINAIDIGAIFAALGAIGKAIHSDSKTKAIQDDSKNTRRSYEERFAVLEQKQLETERHINEADRRAYIQESKLDDVNAKVASMASDVSFIRGILEGRSKD